MGTTADDLFLFRANPNTNTGTIASYEVDNDLLPVVGGFIERLDYNGDIAEIVVNGRLGDDTFIFDDSFSPLTVYGDEGNDTFQLGQVFESARDDMNPTNGLDPEDYFETVQTTRGFLSNGLSETATLYGGEGEDLFTVYRNKAEVFMYGEEGDDNFLVRAFVRVDPNDPKAPFTNINGGQGADFISFTVNAPVRIEGGDGFDTLIVVGTEFGDDFVVNDYGVFGGGLFITYNGIEKLTVDALEGNDRFFIASTSDKVEVEIVGGLGSDTFNVGGSDGKPVTVVSNSLTGNSGLIAQNIVSTYGDQIFQDIFVQDLAVQVADNDEAGMIVVQDKGLLRLFEGAPTNLSDLVVSSYTVVLTRAPESTVRVIASPSSLSERERAAGAKSIALASDEDNPDTVVTDSSLFSETGTVLYFTQDNWYIPQRVTVLAPADSVAEGRRNYNIQHSVIEGAKSGDGEAYDSLAAPNVTVQVYDDDAADVIIAPVSQTSSDPITGTPDWMTRVSESADLFATDIYAVALTRAPAAR